MLENFRQEMFTLLEKKSEPLWRPNLVPLNIKKAIFLNDTERFCAHTVRCNIDLNKFALAVEAPFAECSLDSGEDWMNSNTVQLS